MPVKRKYPHVTSYADRHGKRRWRAVKDGRKAELGTEFGGEIFEERYAAFLAAEPKPVAPKYAAGTFAALITSYQQTHKFAAYAPATKLIYRRVFQQIYDSVGPLPCGDRWFQTHHAQMMINRVQAPAARDTFKKKLGVLMRHAMRIGVRSTDPVTATQSGFEVSDGIHPWTLEQVEQALAAYPMTTPTGLALRLLYETGAALADVVRLGPEHLANGCVTYKRQKLGKKTAPDAVCPLSPELLAHLATIRAPTFLSYSGKPRSGAGLGNRIRAVATGLGFNGSAHGIRKARANALLEAGADLGGIAAILGHSGTSLTAHYTMAANREKIAKTAAEKTNRNPQLYLTERKSDEQQELS